MHVHLLTKYRRGVFTKEVIDDLREIFTGVCADFEAELVEFDGEDDHVHLLVNYPPKVAVSALVNSLKGVSSRMILKKNYPEIKKKLWGRAFGRPVTLQVVVVAHLYPLSPVLEQQRTPDLLGELSRYPRPKERGFTLLMDKK